MLIELSINDFAIIDRLNVRFGTGLSALTGETGAGKSILVDALGAVLGDRVGVDVIRTGATSAKIDATFDISAIQDRPELAAALDEFGVETEEGLLILSREIQSNGRSGARINGRAATATTLARFGRLLVDIHGQSDHLSLLRPAEHLDILDRFGGLLEARDAVGAKVRELAAIRRRLNDLLGSERERAQRADLLRFQVDEIRSAELSIREEDDLQAERTILMNAGRLAQDSALAHALLTGEGDEVTEPAVRPAVVLLRQSLAHLSAIAEIDASCRSLAARLEEIVYLVEDVATDARSYHEQIDADPRRLEQVEDRLATLKSLQRKYGATVADIIEFGEAAASELAANVGGDDEIDILRQREAALLPDLGDMARDLSAARRAGGERLASEVEAAIADLKMGTARFSVSVMQDPDEQGVPIIGDEGESRLVAISATGADRVEFLIAPNAGEALKPLARITSGGEMARLMLALKSILSAADATPSLIFDEVDVGIGGRSGQVVGEKLWELSRDHQVLVITHLPQIAAFATSHFRIAKRERDGRVISDLTALNPTERIDELAAMLNGLPLTEASVVNAREMADRVTSWKGRTERTSQLVSREDDGH